jgi:hypothetical protein
MSSFFLGNVADEGTIFSLTSLNVTTDDEFREYLGYNYLDDVPDQNVSEVMELYPSDRNAGSPFNTSILNAITPQYKRIAAFQGDAVFQAPRRFFVQQRAASQSIWSYRELFRSTLISYSYHNLESSRGMDTPFVGAVCITCYCLLTATDLCCSTTRLT